MEKLLLELKDRLAYADSMTITRDELDMLLRAELELGERFAEEVLDIQMELDWAQDALDELEELKEKLQKIEKIINE